MNKIKIQNSKQLLIGYVLFNRPFNEWYEYKHLQQNFRSFMTGYFQHE